MISTTQKILQNEHVNVLFVNIGDDTAENESNCVKMLACRMGADRRAAAQGSADDLPPLSEDVAHDAHALLLGRELPREPAEAVGDQVAVVQGHLLVHLDPRAGHDHHLLLVLVEVDLLAEQERARQRLGGYFLLRRQPLRIVFGHRVQALAHCGAVASYPCDLRGEPVAETEEHPKDTSVTRWNIEIINFLKQILPKCS